jgi:hypothetical protein
MPSGLKPSGSGIVCGSDLAPRPAGSARARSSVVRAAKRIMVRATHATRALFGAGTPADLRAESAMVEHSRGLRVTGEGST